MQARRHAGARPRGSFKHLLFVSGWIMHSDTSHPGFVVPNITPYMHEKTVEYIEDNTYSVTNWTHKVVLFGIGKLFALE